MATSIMYLWKDNMCLVTSSMWLKVETEEPDAKQNFVHILWNQKSFKL